MTVLWARDGWQYAARQLDDVDQQEDAFAVVSGQQFLRPAFSGWAPPRTSFLIMLGFSPPIPNLESSLREVTKRYLSCNTVW
ncbi:MAG: hypothetical protein OYK82_12845 [Gammaproteobacteria bacterium]|nr:hypothetical protein [Gammaproteobacteria bacterium]